MLLPLMITLYLGSCRGLARHRHRPQGDADDAHGRRPGIAGVEHQQCRHDQHAQCVVGGDRALRYLEAEGDGIGSGDRLQRRRQGRLERYAGRHQARGRIDGHSADRAQRSEHHADLERGRLQLHADDRLCHHRHAQSVRPDLDAAAAVGYGDVGSIRKPERPTERYDFAAFSPSSVRPESAVRSSP